MIHLKRLVVGLSVVVPALLILVFAIVYNLLGYLFIAVVFILGLAFCYLIGDLILQAVKTYCKNPSRNIHKP